jgi:hypothetical protein
MFPGADLSAHSQRIRVTVFVLRSLCLFAAKEFVSIGVYPWLMWLETETAVLGIENRGGTAARPVQKTSAVRPVTWRTVCAMWESVFSGRWLHCGRAVGRMAE